MKKFFTCLAMLAAMATASAQDTTPNRVLVNRNGMPTAFSLERVDSISFATVEGEIKATLDFKKVVMAEAGGVDTLYVNIDKSDDCYFYYIDVLPTNTAKRYDDETFARWFEMYPQSPLSQDFTNGMLYGFNEKLKHNTSYTVVTLAYDKYGVACESSRAEFTTPKIETVGNPSVSYEIDKVTPTSFTLTVTPNEDCAEFYWCQFGKGEAQSQFEMWGPMMNIPNLESMIKQFSMFGYQDESTYTWGQLAPNTEYEVYVLPTDIEGNFGEMVVIPVTTAILGGSGEAKVDVTFGNFYDYGGRYVQEITFTPNDQTAFYRSLIIEKASFDKEWTDESMEEYLANDMNPDIPYDEYWTLYDVEYDLWELDPSTTYYVFVYAANADGVVSPFTKIEYTTPATGETPPSNAMYKAKAHKSSSKGATRLNFTPKKNPFYMMPIKKAEGVTLIQK